MFMFAPIWSLAEEDVKPPETPYYCGTVDIDNDDPINLSMMVAEKHMARTKEFTSYEDLNECGLPGADFKVCLSCTGRFTDDMYKAVKPMIGDIDHIDWHNSWHNEFDKQPRDTFHESFFYMHRHMLKMLNFELAMNGQPCFKGWDKIPNPYDPHWPNPNVDAVNFKEKKSFDSMMRTLGEFSSSKFSKPNSLRGMKLNRLGEVINFGGGGIRSIHGRLHSGYSFDDIFGDCPSHFPSCNSLSGGRNMLNRYFYALHGWIDNHIGKWLKANGYKHIAKDCTDKEDCYQWQGTWLGDSQALRD